MDVVLGVVDVVVGDVDVVLEVVGVVLVVDSVAGGVVVDCVELDGFKVVTEDCCRVVADDCNAVLVTIGLGV